jgi:glycosyltransferase involved in cell wall biosynthesis
MMDAVAAKRPLITFALFAYNQEQYIQEAIEGAFSQTYQPLEIILSDDCSSDNTFKIMQRMSSAYIGPHTIRVNRNPINIGTAAHVSLVFSLSRGRIFVVAAGDDISESTRVEKIVSAWQANDECKSLIHSSMRQFEGLDKGQRHYANLRSINETVNSIEQFVASWRMPAFAPTCAYSREIFEEFPPLSGGSLIEDLPLMVRSLAIARLIYIDEPLVKQRKLESSAGQGFAITRPESWNRFIHSRITALSDIIRDSTKMEKITGKELGRLRTKARKKILSLAGFIIEPKLANSFLVRIRMMMKLTFGCGISGGFIERMKFAMIFAFPERYKRYKLQQKMKRFKV